MGIIHDLEDSDLEAKDPQDLVDANNSPTTSSLDGFIVSDSEVFQEEQEVSFGVVLCGFALVAWLIDQAEHFCIFRYSPT